MSKKLKVCFFVGEDIHSHILINYLLGKLPGDDFEKTVFFPRRAPGGRSFPGALGEYLRLEQKILPEIVYPFLSSPNGSGSDAIVPVYNYGDYYNTHVGYINNVNDHGFINYISSMRFDIGLSIRCYQKFQSDIIKAFSLYDNQVGLLNLHPGTLPFYRGVMIFFREMADRRKNGSYTLHFVDEKWDRGDIVCRKDVVFDLNRSVLWNYINLAPVGGQFIFDIFRRIRSGESIGRHSQDSQAARYWTYPTIEELNHAASNGIRLFDHDEFSNEIGKLCGSMIKSEAEEWCRVAQAA